MVFSLLFKTRKFFGKNKKKFAIIMIFFSIFNCIFYFYKTNINTIIKDTIEVKCKALAVKAMNNAISEVVMGEAIYEDLISIKNDSEGNISYIKANSIEINHLSKNLSQQTEIFINSLGNSGVKVAIGDFTGIPLLVGLGPKISLKIKPVGAVVCRFSSKFESAGINQTNHKIYLTVSSTVSTVIPLITSKVNAEQEVLISESIIIGKVPEVYLYSDQLDTLLNFVPY